MITTNIYTLSDPITSEIRYVGKTNNIKERYHHHLNVSHNIKSHKTHWIKSLKEKGLIPIIEIIDIVPMNDWIFWEKYWISQIKTWGFNLVNHTNGGEGCIFGNIASFKKGSIPWNKGIKGYSTSKKGYHVSQEIRDKISKTLTGRPSLHKRSVIQYNKNMEKINEFDSITEASKITRIKGVRNVVTGRAKTAGGYIWQ